MALRPGVTDRTAHGVFALTIAAIGIRTSLVLLQPADTHEPFLLGRFALVFALVLVWLLVWRSKRTAALILGTCSAGAFAAVLAMKSGNLAGEPLTIVVVVQAVAGLFGSRTFARLSLATSAVFSVGFVVSIQAGWINGRDFVADQTSASQAAYAVAILVTASLVVLANGAAAQLGDRLELSNAEIEATFASTPIGIATVDERCVVRRSNRALDLMLVGPTGTMTGQELRSATGGPWATSMAGLISASFQGALPDTSRDVVFSRPDGSLAYTQVRLGRVGSTGDPRLLTVTIDDVSEQRLLKREVEMMQRRKSLGTLAGGLAHDFNNLLGAVQAQVAVARTRSRDGQCIEESLDKVIEGTERASSLTRQLLDYAGNDELAKSDLQANEVVRDVVRLFSPSLASVTVDLDLADSLPKIVGNNGGLQQVIMNLLLNARSAIGSNEGTITVATKVCSSAELEGGAFPADTDLAEVDEYVCIAVADTGCGISAVDLDHIFDPFFTTDTAGHGLGLSMVLGIVRSHQGHVRVTSEQDVGSTFTVLVPVKPAR